MSGAFAALSALDRAADVHGGVTDAALATDGELAPLTPEDGWEEPRVTTATATMAPTAAVAATAMSARRCLRCLRCASCWRCSRCRDCRNPRDPRGLRGSLTCSTAAPCTAGAAPDGHRAASS